MAKQRDFPCKLIYFFLGGGDVAARRGKTERKISRQINFRKRSGDFTQDLFTEKKKL